MVDSPVCAKAVARLLLIKLLPSPGTEDVTKIVFNFSSTAENCKFVLTILRASATFDFGSFWTIN